ncbi:MAG: hypothetical protein JXB49_32720 [Bacteroidales bacterium]|nr:hypothetical protein [Bacteroidales bacterium]
MFAELNALICFDSCLSKELKLKFLNTFNVQPNHTYLDKILIHAGNEIQFMDKGSVKAYIYGDIYEGFGHFNSFLETLTQKQRPDNMLADINGSFIAVIVNTTTQEVYVITDRINSKRIFYHITREFILLTNIPHHLSNFNSSVDAAGIASFLINGAVYNNHTLFKEVMSFDRACIHHITNTGITSHTYWHYTFTNEYAGIPKPELKKKFADVLMKSMERRIRSMKPETCFVSLSGGYDSRFILGALREIGGPFDLRSFSYGMTEKEILGDDVIAEELAALAGFKHHFEPAYNNDFLETLALNAQYGGGLANFCDEISAWIKLGALFSGSSKPFLFVGDMFFHSSPDIKVTENKGLAAFAVNIYTWHQIMPVLGLLPDNLRQELIREYENLYQAILKRLPAGNNYSVLKDFAYLDQRISHTLNYWREYTQGPFVKVTQPLLDNDILDFHRKLPDDKRFAKSLYKETLREMFPDLFAVPIAKNVWSYPSWIGEIVKNKDEIIQHLLSRKSLLDDIIPREVIHSLISDANRAYDTSNVNILLKILKRTSNRNDYLHKSLAGYVSEKTRIAKTKLMIRLLLLRESLLC